MAAYVYETPNEKAISGALALVMHALFFAMLVLSVSWQRQEAPAMMAELWSNLPPTKSEVPPPPPPPSPPKVVPEPPKPAPRVEPKPEPKAEPKIDKADIDLREKKEKERKEKERELAEKKKQQQQELAEKKKREEREKAEALKLAQAKEAAEARRKAQEQADALKKLAAQQAAGRQNELNKYKQAVADRIRRFITEPPNLQGNPEVEFEVIQLPGGEILGIKTTRGSGQAIWDNAVERAIQRAQPLPPPPNPSMFQDVRELHLKFRPKE